MITLYRMLSLLGLIAPVALCFYLLSAFIRFMLPKYLIRKFNIVAGKHDGLLAAMFMLLFNRAWLSARHFIFGSRLDTFEPGELPYLNASLAFGCISMIFLAMMLSAYRKRS